MATTEEYVKKQGWKRVERTKRWYRMPEHYGNLWIKVSKAVGTTTLVFSELRNAGGVYLVYSVTGDRATPKVKPLATKRNYTEALGYAKAWMRQHD